MNDICHSTEGEPLASKVSQPNKAVAMRLKELRQEQGWSQRVMATLMDVTLTRYQKCEQRGRLPAELLPKFSKLVNKSIDFILTGEERD
jgi:transcriptional regulator with XRE-family HTH domain